MDVPWARVRLADPAGPDGCAHCGGPAVLVFRVEYERRGAVVLDDGELGEVESEDVQQDSFACLSHAGFVAYGVSLEMVSARSALF